jgi:hypothetical protein
VATVTALVNCPEGQQVQVRASLAQHGVFGQGVGVGECTGGLERYEVTAPAQGRARFVEEPAHAEANAIAPTTAQTSTTSILHAINVSSRCRQEICSGFWNNRARRAKPSHIHLECASRLSG